MYMSWQYWAQKLMNWTFQLTLWVTFSGMRLIRRYTIQVMPKPHTQQDVLRNAVIPVGGWAIGLAMLFLLLSSNPGGLFWGAVAGIVVGGFTGLGVYRNGMLHVAAGGDAIQLGRMKDRHGIDAPFAIPRES